MKASEVKTLTENQPLFFAVKKNIDTIACKFIASRWNANDKVWHIEVQNIKTGETFEALAKFFYFGEFDNYAQGRPQSSHSRIKY
jgi:hypothetical protein